MQMRDQFFPSPISGTEIHPITIRDEICKNRKRIQRSISISSRFRVDEMRRAEQTEASDNDAHLARLIRNTRGKERREKNIVASATQRKKDRTPPACIMHAIARAWKMANYHRPKDEIKLVALPVVDKEEKPRPNRGANFDFTSGDYDLRERNRGPIRTLFQVYG